MKLAKWILLISLFGSYVQAQTPPVFERQRVKVQMYRNTIIKESDDTFRKVKTELCKDTFEMDVFDLRSTGGTFIPPTLNCKFEVNQIKRHINLMFMSAIDRSDFDSSMPMTDVKTYMAWLNPEGLDVSSDLPIPSSALPVSTKDLYTKSMILHFRPNQYFACVQSELKPSPPPQIPDAPTFRIAQKSQQDCMIINPDALGAVVEYETIP